MSLAGHTRRCTNYLMGNHLIAETMYRHEPSVALYVPLRCAIYEADGGRDATKPMPTGRSRLVGFFQPRPRQQKTCF